MVFTFERVDAGTELCVPGIRVLISYLSDRFLVKIQVGPTESREDQQPDNAREKQLWCQTSASLVSSVSDETADQCGVSRWELEMSEIFRTYPLHGGDSKRLRFTFKDCAIQEIQSYRA